MNGGGVKKLQLPENVTGASTFRTKALCREVTTKPRTRNATVIDDRFAKSSQTKSKFHPNLTKM